ncbi:transcription factor cwo [Lycorma delicatula]|uniref:transcription factor cwo n=1 Tax=Lycorma delicatula TaxID=130591 RepID=UPI003F517192
MDSPATTYWEDSTSLHTNLKYERCSSNGGPSPRPCKEEQNSYRYCDSTGNLNFTTAVNSEDDEYNYHKKKIPRDPMSHRIIEKRRRDRMNNCLADLSRLIPADYLKKGRGRIEKTEIIEMAIKHMKYLQAHACSHIDGYGVDTRQTGIPHRHNESDDTLSPPDSLSKERTNSIFAEHYRQGYHECLSEAMHFLVDVEGFYSNDSLCVALFNHLTKHCDKQSDRFSSNGELRPSISCIESTTSTSSPGSTGGSSNTNCKVQNGDPGSSSGSEGGSSAIGSRSNEDLYDNHHPSQLRDILTCPSLNSHSVSRMQLAVDSQSPSTTAVIGSTLSNDSHSSSGTLYKFKNNIKQRFSAEHPERSVISINRTTTDSPARGNKRRHSTDLQQSQMQTQQPHQPQQLSSEAGTPPPSQLSSSLPGKYNSLPSVPIFALHSKGSYYIPLTVDYDILAPYVGDILLESHQTNLSSVVLHPVTISVNFHHHPQKLPLYSSIPMIAPNGWNNQNGVTSNDFLPLPKWASCTSERS